MNYENIKKNTVILLSKAKLLLYLLNNFAILNLVKSFLTLIDFDNLFGMEFPFGYKYFKLFKEILKWKKY